MRKEPLKLLTIVLLFVTATILTGIKFNFFSNLVEAKNQNLLSANSKEMIGGIIRPSRMTVNLGGNVKTVLYNQNPSYYQDAKRILVEAIGNNSELVEVDTSKYVQQKEIKSLEIKFDTPVDSRLLSRSLFLDKGIIADAGKIDAILIPLVDDNNIYLKVVNKIYKLKLKTRANMPLVDILNTKNPVKFYSLKELYDSSSEALVELDGKIPQKSYITSSRYARLEDKAKVAKYIFGDKYDFISKMIGVDESVTYTYDFGQEYLKIKNSGAIEYINEDYGDDKGSNIEGSIDEALNFLSTLNFDLRNLKLCSVQEIKIKDRLGFRVKFLEEIDGFEVQSSLSNYEINVDLVGNKVYAMKGLNRHIERPIVTEEEPIPAMNVIDLNFESLKLGIGFQSGKQLIDLISDVKQVYKYDEDYNLVPYYRMTINARPYYFDVYTGEEVKNGLE